MTTDEFRKNGHQLIEWLAEYMENVESFPVRADVEPGSIRSLLPPSAPEQPESFDKIIADLNEVIMPGITHWQSPSFMAYFPANASPASILGELVSAGLGVQGMLWSTSPACTELETHVLDWLVELLGLPSLFLSSGNGGGVIQDTASSATLAAVLAARERATGSRSNDFGLVGEQSTHAHPEYMHNRSGTLIAYASEHAHSSVEKAMMIAGLGSKNLRIVPVDEHYALDTSSLEAMVAADVAAGNRPFIICGTIGTTSSGAVDPIRRIGEIANQFDVWFHVDAAYAGSASVCPEFRSHQDGLELADSYTFNPHKWLLTNFDCNCLFVADRTALTNTFSILPEYLRNKETTDGSVIDYRDWHVQLGRRFRSLKLWFVLRSYGAVGLRDHIRRHVDFAKRLADEIRNEPGWTVVAPVFYGLVTFRHRGGDAVNEAIMNRANESGRVFLTHTKLEGRMALRMAIGGRTTEWRHVEHAWALLKQLSVTVDKD